ncbi:hypothetical protein HK105_202063 [Polyrhizophydium stewartii]|uniref:Methyltransferase domain-containing protein n=1 Tax=Polyrhizophydium stewartii TaxID=2732419 RepID=A0ABR4NF91_9FUNG|nr:hypothetical protein HK105_000427 [Polyrhizophydium stewartii]
MTILANRRALAVAVAIVLGFVLGLTALGGLSSLFTSDDQSPTHVDAVAKVQVPDRDSEHDALIKKTARCIALSNTFQDSESCWTDFKRIESRLIMDELDKLPRADTLRMLTQANYAPHKILIPTHQCNMLKLQRFPGQYARDPKGLHPDGPKWMCPEYLETPDDSPCTIFSVGSNGQFDFEEAMHSFVGNKCKIYTFDCTGNWTNPTTEFHPWCISNENTVNEKGHIFKTLTQIMHDVNVTHIHLFKIDVEGYEFQTVQTLLKEPRENLPRQILMEVHFGYQFSFFDYNPEKESWIPYATKLYRDMDTMGYSIALRELNYNGDCCSEYVFIRNP